MLPATSPKHGVISPRHNYSKTLLPNELAVVPPNKMKAAGNLFLMIICLRVSCARRVRIQHTNRKAPRHMAETLPYARL